MDLSIRVEHDAAGSGVPEQVRKDLERFLVPGPAVRLRGIRQHINSMYCIPEIEPHLAQPEERSRRAMAWLQAVMAECNRVGLHVQFSFEPNTLKSRNEASADP